MIQGKRAGRRGDGRQRWGRVLHQRTAHIGRPRRMVAHHLLPSQQQPATALH